MNQDLQSTLDAMKARFRPGSVDETTTYYLSLGDSEADVDGEESGRGTEALREVLRLHDFAGEPAMRRQIDGIHGVRSAPSFARI